MKLKFYECTQCGNLVVVINEGMGTMECCGEQMKCLTPHVFDEGAEKHVPQVKIDGCVVTVEVSTVMHPSTSEHYIRTVVLETTEGFKVKHLQPGDKPKVKFCLCDCETYVAAYAYCNLHGLWMTKNA
ncbi:MAG: desulfoferrodoxin [Bacteroidales bacterium]|nr:desulfoferrodoxin [Bacteroidales bacterium]